MIYNKEYDPNNGIDELPIISCGKSEQPEAINEIFMFTFNYYCLKLYNLIADFICKNIDAQFDTFRFDLRLKRGNIIRHLHPRWDFDKMYYQS